MRKKLLSLLGIAVVSCMMVRVPVYAQGDPPKEEFEILQENPGDNLVLQEETEETTQPLSFDGTGTIVDNITQGSKQFYTISTDAGNVFYLIVDLDKETNNVYFLDTTKERDLLALAEAAEEEQGVVIEKEEVPMVAEIQPPAEVEVKANDEPVKRKSDGSLGIILLLTIVGGVGVIFYYWVYKPKKDKDEAEEFEETFDFKDDDSFDDEDTYGE